MPFNTGETEDFKDIKPELGVISDLEALIKAAKEKGQQIFLELDPNHSSVNHPWFKRSVNREEPFTSYYVWADGIINIDNGKVRRSPPNNWVSHTHAYYRKISREIVDNMYTLLTVEYIRRIRMGMARSQRPILSPSIQ